MKILSAEQIGALDKYTIQHEPVASIDLMERAGTRFVEAVTEKIKPTDKVYIFCGMGNNGGDGLAVARMLLARGYQFVNTYIVKHSADGSPDFKLNEDRLKTGAGISYIENESQLPVLDKQSVVIDAILGSGLSRPVDGIAAAVIRHINQSGSAVYSIDMPSGLYCDKPNTDSDTVIQSTVTYTFHAPKLSFMFAANGQYVPQFKVLDIGLNQQFAENSGSPYHYTDRSHIQSFFKERPKFSHKGTYGHALIAAGSHGKMGAAVLSVMAALRSGAGLVSAHIPGCGYDIMQLANPEAMVHTDADAEILTTMPSIEAYSAIGVGPGIGTEPKTVTYLKRLLTAYLKPMVLDADALNIISKNSDLLALIPPYSILTPHPGEFKRLVGDWTDDLDKLHKQILFSSQYKVVLVLKGANTSIAIPDGQVHFNSSGNAGMAKGGSGDVLTGILTALLTQGYPPDQAAVLGVFVHGLAGDLAKANLGETSMNASDLVTYLPQAFKSFGTLLPFS